MVKMRDRILVTLFAQPVRSQSWFVKPVVQQELLSGVRAAETRTSVHRVQGLVFNQILDTMKNPAAQVAWDTRKWENKTV